MMKEAIYIYIYGGMATVVAKAAPIDQIIIIIIIIYTAITL